MMTMPAQGTLPGPTPSDKARQQQMSTAWKAYRGDFPAPIKKEEDEPDFSVRSNLCGPIVQTGVDFLFGKGVSITVASDADEDEAADASASPGDDMQSVLDACWGDEDDRTVFFQKLAMNGGICGQVFVKIIPPTQEGGRARFIVLDPQHVSVVTAPDDCDYVTCLIIQYEVPNANGVGSVIHRQIIQRVESQEEAMGAPDYADMDESGDSADWQGATTWTISTY